MKAGDRTGSSSSRLWGTVTLAYPPSLPKEVTKRNRRTTTSIAVGGHFKALLLPILNPKVRSLSLHLSWAQPPKQYQNH